MAITLVLTTNNESSVSYIVLKSKLCSVLPIPVIFIVVKFVDDMRW